MALVREKKCSALQCFNPECSRPITVVDLKLLLKPDEFEEYNTNALAELITTNQDLVKCPNPKCNAVIERMAIEVDPKKRMPWRSKTYLSDLSEAEIHKEQCRFRCRECETEFCAECGNTPYHEGYTCTSFKEYQTSKHCRFCGVQLSLSNRAVASRAELVSFSYSIFTKEISWAARCVQQTRMRRFAG